MERGNQIAAGRGRGAVAGGRPVELLLRIGVAMCFIGHGAFGILRKEAWVPYFGMFGIEPSVAREIMPLVGAVDIAVGVGALLAPVPALFAYAALWCAWTALLRPLAGEGVWEALERAGNYGVPAALLLALGAAHGWFRRSTPRELTSPAVLMTLQFTTAALLVGHGALAIAMKPLLVEHLAWIGVPAALVPVIGWIEVGAAAACLLTPAPGLFLAVAGWKIATELLFPLTGAPLWEFVERGGSYVAPLALALLLARQRVSLPRGFEPAALRTRTSGVPALATRRGMWSGARIRWRNIATVILLATGSSTAVHAQAAPQLSRLDARLLDRLRDGGYVFACRHAATHDTEDATPVDFDNPATQRRLHPQGERDAEEAGRALRALGLPPAEVLSSPYQRTRRSAELMFGSTELDHALYYGKGKAQRVRELLTTTPAAGRNRVLMTHQGVLYGALARPRGSIAEGDCVIVEPLGSDFRLIAQVGVDEWAAFASRRVR